MRFAPLLSLKWLILLSVFLSTTLAIGPGDWKKHSSPTQDVLHNAFFITDSKGWAISHNTGLVLYTDNGGKKWVVQARLGEGYLELIHFSDMLHGWICGDGGRVFKTVNGGNRWSLVGSFNKTAAFYAIYFFDNQKGFVAGLDAHSRQGVFFESNDGGSNWIDRSKEINISRGFTDAVFFLNKKIGFVAGTGSILSTNDGGKTWHKQDADFLGVVRALFFHNAQTGWAIGHKGLLLKTSDGGKTWEKKAPFTTSLLRSIVFLNEKRGFIVGDKSETGCSLWITSDGGNTWQETKEKYQSLHRLVLSPKNLWAIGDSGTILSRSR